MQLLIYGPGRLGGAIAAAAVSAGWPTPGLVGRPDPTGRRAEAPRVDVVVDASAGASIAGNVAHALDGGNRAFVLAATGWEPQLPVVRSLLLEHGASAVVAPNLSLGRGAVRPARGDGRGLVRAGRRLRAVDRRVAPERQGRPTVGHGPGAGAPDRRRRPALGPRRRAGSRGRHAARCSRSPGSAPAPRPGTHLVTFDGNGESVELRLAARDRSAYADGALAAARWLLAEPREPGLHPFDAVVDDLLAPVAIPA